MVDAHSNFVELSSKTFEDLAEKHDFLIISLGTDWCGPCREFTTVFTDAAGEHRDVSFAIVDIDEDHELADAFDVQAVPKIAVMCGGAMVFSHEGMLTDEALENIIQQVRRLDVDSIRRTAAGQK